MVIRNQLPYRGELVFIVPLSSTPPEHDVPYSFKLSKNYLSNGGEAMYAKCDLVCSVSLARLDRIKMGYRQYGTPKMLPEDFDRIVAGVKYALGFAS